MGMILPIILAIVFIGIPLFLGIFVIAPIIIILNLTKNKQKS